MVSKPNRRRTATWGAAAALAALAGTVALPGTAQAAPNTGSGTTWIWDTSATQIRTVAWTMSVDSLWNAGTTGKGVGVALIDTGVTQVPGLNSGNVVNGPDLSFESQDANKRYKDTYGHGTHLAGIIAGRDTTGGVDAFTGIAPDVKLTSLKVGVTNGAVDVTQAIAAIDWVVAHRNDDPANPIRVINLAYGTDGTQDYKVDPLSHAVENAWRAGIAVVVAAGNGGPTAKLANPARDPFVISVAAVDSKNNADRMDDAIASFSSRGDATRRPDIAVPGRSIVSLRAPGSYIDTNFPGARYGDRFFRGSGTSQAAAVVSGVVAQMIQRRPTLTPDQIKKLLVDYAHPMPLVSNPADAGIGLVYAWNSATAYAPASTQTFAKSTGTGKMELARGTVHISDSGKTLSGENSIFGSFNVSAWATASTKGTAWSGGKWMGLDLTGTGYANVSGVQSWNGRSWSGRSWSGRSWSGTSWSSLTWLGFGWT